MKKLEGASTKPVFADILIVVEPGLNSVIARELHERVRTFDCALTLTSARGVADVRQLFELLMIGAKTGDRLELRGVGPDAPAAVAAIKQLLERTP